VANNLLFVEDSEYKKNLVIDFIDSLGLNIDIQHASSFTSGSQAIAKNSFDIILLDLSLPTFDKSEQEAGGRFRAFGGKEIARKLIRAQKKSKIIFITQYESFSDKDNFYTFDSLREQLSSELSPNYVGMIHFHSFKSGWKDELQKAIGLATNENSNS